jgi:hypothetical protein
VLKRQRGSVRISDAMSSSDSGVGARLHSWQDPEVRHGRAPLHVTETRIGEGLGIALCLEVEQIIETGIETVTV